MESLDKFISFKLGTTDTAFALRANEETKKALIIFFINNKDSRLQEIDSLQILFLDFLKFYYQGFVFFFGSELGFDFKPNAAP